jgi:hypothetical protein
LVISALFALPAEAQDEVPLAKASVDAALPAEIRLLLAGNNNVQSLFSVDGSEPFAGTLLKANVISFSANSELVLQNSTAPYIVIAARDVKFPDATSGYRIRFADVDMPAGANGPDGARGADGQGEVNYLGGSASAGAIGQTGGTGGTRLLPHVYLVVDSFSIGSNPNPRLINLSLKLRGVSGGDGGSGGIGGDGGNGAVGHEASQSAFRCLQAGGNGGRGGDGGVGGTGGSGGQGGNGGSLTFLSTKKGVGQFGYASILNQGGFGGGYGRSGRGGIAGNGGPGGSGNFHCHGGDGGSVGSLPAAAATGTDGEQGAKGKVTLISVPVVKMF